MEAMPNFVSNVEMLHFLREAVDENQRRSDRHCDLQVISGEPGERLNCIEASRRWQKRCDGCREDIPTGAVGFRTDEAREDSWSDAVGPGPWEHGCGAPMPPTSVLSTIGPDDLADLCRAVRVVLDDHHGPVLPETIDAVAHDTAQGFLAGVTSLLEDAIYYEIEAVTTDTRRRVSETWWQAYDLLTKVTGFPWKTADEWHRTLEDTYGRRGSGPISTDDVTPGVLIECQKVLYGDALIRLVSWDWHPVDNADKIMVARTIGWMRDVRDGA